MSALEALRKSALEQRENLESELKNHGMNLDNTKNEVDERKKEISEKEKKLSDMRVRVENAQKREKELEEELCREDVAKDHVKLAEISKALTEKKDDLDEKYESWLQLQE